MNLKKDWLSWIVNPFLWILISFSPLPGMAQSTPSDSISSVDSLFYLNFKGFAPLLSSIDRDTVQKKDSLKPAYLQFVDSSLYSRSGMLTSEPLLKPFFRPHSLPARPFQKSIMPWHGNEVSFAILFFCFILLAGAQYSYGKRITQVLRACLNERYMAQLVRNGDLYNERISLYLFLVFILSVPLLILEVNHYYLAYVMPTGPLGMLSTYLLILGVYAILYGLKILALRIAGVIFKTYSATQEYILTLFVFNLAEGIILIVFLVFILYADSFLMLQGCLLVLGLIFAYRLLRSFLLGVSESKYSILYLLLFFSCLEVLPIIVLVKVLMKYFPA